MLGDNTHGQLGNGTTTDAEAPSGVDLTGAVQVVAGGEQHMRASAHRWRRVLGTQRRGQAGATGARMCRPATVELPAAVDFAAGGGNDARC